MPNIYRVISLSLVMSLFFAAPLLCIQPVAHKLKKDHGVAVKDPQSKRVRVVVWEKSSTPPQVKAAAALATSLQRSLNNADELRCRGENCVATPALFVQEQDEDGYGHESDELDVAGVNGVSISSHSYHYY